MKRTFFGWILLLSATFASPAFAATSGGACIQVITPAVSSSGECKEYPTPCDVPSGWKKVGSCDDTSLVDL